jgi:PAS domain S-box-containing protein
VRARLNLSVEGGQRLNPRTQSVEATGTDAQLRLLAAHVQDHAIFLLDAGGRVTSWNAGAHRMWGYPSREILGEHFSRFYSEDDVAGRRPSDALAEAARSGRAEEEGPRIRRDGSSLLTAWILRAVRSRGGRLQGFAVVARDVTELRRAEVERERLARAQEVARIQTAFLAALAHELRTPVTSLRLEVESLTRQLRREERRPELERLLPRLAGLTRQSDRLARLIEAFLSLPRFGAEGAAIAPAELDAAAVLRDIADELRQDPALQDVPVAITRAVPATVWADPALFQLLAWTLLANAFRYGGGAPVDVRVVRERAEARLEVRDGGIGIAPADQERIFEPFERAVPATAYPGLGLGLWIARQIAAAHGGSLTVESTPGRGATFVLRLPQPPG